MAQVAQAAAALIQRRVVKRRGRVDAGSTVVARVALAVRVGRAGRAAVVAARTLRALVLLAQARRVAERAQWARLQVSARALGAVVALATDVGLVSATEFICVNFLRRKFSDGLTLLSEPS